MYAFLGLSCSVYAQPSLQVDALAPATAVATVVFALFSVAAASIAALELACMTLLTDGFVIANAMPETGMQSLAQSSWRHCTQRMRSATRPTCAASSLG